jgi:hypothetical protein
MASKESTPEQSIESFVDKNFARETAFLAELVKIPPTIRPAIARHMPRAKELLTGLGFEVEAHSVPAALSRLRA